MPQLSSSRGCCYLSRQRTSLGSLEPPSTPSKEASVLSSKRSAALKVNLIKYSSRAGAVAHRTFGAARCLSVEGEFGAELNSPAQAIQPDLGLSVWSNVCCSPGAHQL